jgi:hypothetical protein
MKRGRPRLAPDDRLVPVSVRLPAKEYDALCAKAQREAVSVPEVIRRALRLKVFIKSSMG